MNPLIFTLLSGKVLFSFCPLHFPHSQGLLFIYISVLNFHLPAFIRSNYEATIKKMMSTDIWFNMTVL